MNDLTLQKARAYEAEHGALFPRRNALPTT